MPVREHLREIALKVIELRGRPGPRRMQPVGYVVYKVHQLDHVPLNPLIPKRNVLDVVVGCKPKGVHLQTCRTNKKAAVYLY